MRPRSWSDARLATVESHWLGLTRSGDMSGAEVPAAWQRWLQAGDASAFAGILSHNRLDLLSLAAILQRALFDRPDDLLLRAEVTMTKLTHWTARAARLHHSDRANTTVGLG